MTEDTVSSRWMKVVHLYMCMPYGCSTKWSTVHVHITMYYRHEYCHLLDQRLSSNTAHRWASSAPFWIHPIPIHHPIPSNRIFLMWVSHQSFDLQTIEDVLEAVALLNGLQELRVSPVSPLLAFWLSPKSVEFSLLIPRACHVILELIGCDI